MVPNLSQPRSVNVLLNDANWAWPRAVEEIFQPRGVNALLADTAGDVVRLVDQNKIHLTILDISRDEHSGIQTLRMIRKHDPLMPCILLAHRFDTRLLAEALLLDAFSVMGKPVDLDLLAGQVDRLFVKYYASDMFATAGHPKSSTRSNKISIRIKSPSRNHDKRKE